MTSEPGSFPVTRRGPAPRWTAEVAAPGSSEEAGGFLGPLPSFPLPAPAGAPQVARRVRGVRHLGLREMGVGRWDSGIGGGSRGPGTPGLGKDGSGRLGSWVSREEGAGNWTPLRAGMCAS